MKPVEFVRDAVRHHPKRVALLLLNGGIAAGLCAALVSGCFATATPIATTIANTESGIQCIQKYWGQPIGVVAANCTNADLAAAEDIISDVEALFEANSTDAGSGFIFPYETPSMRAKVNARKATPASKK